jgi:mycothiol synthase
VNRRRYRDGGDVALLQAFNAAAIAQTDGCGFIHPGDIAHRLFNGNKLFDPAEVLTIWEDTSGIAAWVLASPLHHGYDAQVRSDLRTPEFEREVLVYAEAETRRLMSDHEISTERLDGEAYRCDTARAVLLTELGWVRDGEPPWVLNRVALSPLAEPQVPHGYAIRAVRGIQEAPSLGAVHGASFGSTWTPEMYSKVMRSPGYAPEREFVAEAADGTLAAFIVTWHDHLNRTGLFEPVGTHRDHRRRGLGKALLLFAMSAMATEGMEYATVVNEGTNEASGALYASVGFTPWHLLDGYTKPV